MVVAIQVEADEEVAYDVNLLFKDDATNALVSVSATGVLVDPGLKII